MGPVNRLFMGQLTPGDFRARISKDGHNADDPALSRDNLQMDSAWPFAGNLHKVAILTPGLSATVNSPGTVYFPELAYVPMIQVLKGQITDLNNERWIFYGPVGTNFDQQISFSAYADRVVIDFDGPYRPGRPFYLVVLVYKIPARLLAAVSSPRPLPRMMIGKRGANYGLYVSRPGENVITCAPEMLTFNSDDAPAEVSTTQSGTLMGTSSTVGDGALTRINVNYVWKGYFPIVLMFVTKALNASNQWYYLPTDKPISTNSYGENVRGIIAIRNNGTIELPLRYVSTATRIYWSCIVIDYPLPNPV